VSAYLSVCAIYRDEARFLAEWIELHRLVGADRFFLYDNFSVDDHREVLAPYVERGIVTLHDWPVEKGQLPAYNDCLERHREDSRWIAFLDLDEFLFSPTGRPVSEVLVDYEDAPAVVANWAVFGTSGHRTEPDGLVIENYLMRRHDITENCPYKSIVDPRRTLNGSARVHFFSYAEGTAVDENHAPVAGARAPSETASLSYSKLRINHYMTKSEQSYIRKRTRGRAAPPEYPPMAEDALVKLDRGFNQERDTTITTYVPQLREALRAPALRSRG
jgi:hypothetical protein